VTRPLRFGTLGAARITPKALTGPAREVGGVEVAAVAARDEARARSFAAKHGIPRVHASYSALLADPEIDAVYNPLPNSLHCEWTLRALDAGKHVLCEKPLASNAEEAQRMTDAAERAGRVLAEAFHWRYHPLAERMAAITGGGELGTLRRVEASVCFPLLVPGDIRYRRDLSGGALMDAGCYAVCIARFLAACAPQALGEPEVVAARAKLSSPDVDRAMDVDLRFANGVSGRVRCSLLSARVLELRARVSGERGELSVFNPVMPQLYHRLTLKTAGGTRAERVPGEASYTGQLRAFAAWVRGGEPMPSDGADGVANMRVIDAAYRAAGLSVRGAS
jgi:predicted dehydrogenase